MLNENRDHISTSFFVQFIYFSFFSLIEQLALLNGRLDSAVNDWSRFSSHFSL